MADTLTIEDLLNALNDPNVKEKTLENTEDTWKRIQAKDSFDELGLDKSELESFLEDWMSNNSYNDI